MTFVVFIMVPEVVYVLLVHQMKAVDDVLVYQINNLFWNVGLTADALLYIFFNETVKKKFSRMFRKTNINSHSATNNNRNNNGLALHSIVVQ